MSVKVEKSPLARKSSRLRKGDKILLILPCNQGAKFGNYKLGRNWRLVLKHIRPWREKALVDLAAADCIRNLGIVGEWENEKTRDFDVYPSWRAFNREKLAQLKEAMKGWLKKNAREYKHILVYINVRAYYMALEAASREAGINVEFIRLTQFSPMAFCANIHKVVQRLKELFPWVL